MKLNLQYFAEETADTVPAAARIWYLGYPIASLHSGQSATLHCAGQRALSDIMVEFSVIGEIFHVVATEVEGGKTATLHCATKRLTGDIVVTVQQGYETESNAVGTTVVLRGFTTTANENGHTVQIL
ncbi:MAG: hypothetical protein E7618_07030 [Ruminococcaceae bacterium]|nr:hypothetical protein [Oscillospiraceae bacterium]